MKSEFSLPYYFSKENRPFEKRKVRQVKKKKKNQNKLNSRKRERREKQANQEDSTMVETMAVESGPAKVMIYADG